MERKCKNCRFWFSSDNDSGQCRRHAPRHIFAEISGQFSPVEKENAVWAFTNKDDWCGEWGNSVDEDDEELSKKLKQPIETLNLSALAYNCLKDNKINTVGQLVTMIDPALLKFHSFGRACLRQVKRKLADRDLFLGMNNIND